MSTVLRGDDNFDSASPAITDFGEVGTYAFACHPTSRLSFGDTASGSTLRGSAFTVFSTPTNNVDAYVGLESSSSLSGTWRCMSQHGMIGNTSQYYTSTFGIFVRVS